MKHFLTSIVLAVSVASCALTPQQRADLQLQLSVLKQVGQDLVAIDCTSAGLIEIIAKDAGAAQRVQNVLARNSQIARDACPALTGQPAIQVTTSS